MSAASGAGPAASTGTAVVAEGGSPAGGALPRRLGGGRNEWLLVAFTATTNLADAVIRVALPLLAASLTGSAAVVAGVATVLTLPWLLTALYVGVLVDRANRRTLMTAAEVARLAAVCGIGAALVLDAVSIGLIFAVAAVLGVAEVVALTAGAAIIPSAVPPHRRQAANARITAVEYLCNGFLGAPVGGFLVAAGTGIALGGTAAAYVAGAVLLAALAGDFTVRPGTPPRLPATPSTPQGSPATPSRRGVHAEIREGLAFLWRHRLLRTMSLLIAVMAGCWSAWLAVLPVYAVAPGPLGLDPRGYGLVLACLGAGGVAGTLLVGPVNRLLGRRWSMFADIIGTFLLVAAPAVWPPGPGGAWAVGGTALLAGLGGTMWTVNSRVITQSLVPAHLLGRFSAAVRLIGWGSVPIAAATAGLLVELAGFRVAFAAFAVLCAALVYPFLRVVTARAVSGAEPG